MLMLVLMLVLLLMLLVMVCHRFRLVVPVSKDTDPLQWWAANQKEYPLLALFMKSNGAMQPTSLASERLFNKDKLLFGTTRVMLTEE